MQATRRVDKNIIRGANFVKAFQCFGEDLATSADDDPDSDFNNDIELNDEPGFAFPSAAAAARECSGINDDLEPEPLSALENLRLLPHRKFMAHTLNLMANDTENVNNKHYKTLSRSVFAKPCVTALNEALKHQTLLSKSFKMIPSGILCILQCNVCLP